MNKYFSKRRQEFCKCLVAYVTEDYLAWVKEESEKRGKTISRLIQEALNAELSEMEGAQS